MHSVIVTLTFFGVLGYDGATETHGMKKRTPFIFLGIGIVLVTLIPSLYFYNKYQAVNQKLMIGDKDNVEALVKQVSKHVLLPTGETPTIMTVTDKEKLSGQQFFANAKNGDKVLVYTNAKKAFLYDVVEDRLLEIGPVISASVSATIAPQQAVLSPTPTAVQIAPRFVLYNGTTTVGLTKQYTLLVEEKIAGAKVIDTDNATKKDYTTSIIVDISKTRGEEVATYAKTLDLTVSSLPAGETATTSADFLIILGADQK